MEGLLVVAVFVLLAAVMAAVIGFFLQGLEGGIALPVATVIASVFCIAVGLLIGWPATVFAVFLIERGGTWVSRQIFSTQGVKYVRRLWFWYVIMGVLIYLNKTWWGLIAIALPPFVLLWGGLFFISGYILPIQDNDQYLQAFRSLLTFSLGSNYPYHIIRDWKKEDRPKPVVDGNTFAKFFAGPGIALTSCDHLVVTSTRVKKNTVKPPGLAFTGKYERIQAVVDLRPQLRVFTVNAETCDGIPVSVFTFWPTQIDSGRRKPGLRKSFPFLKKAVFKAVYQQPRDHEWKQDKNGLINEEIRRIDWDDLLAKSIGPPIIKKVILDYTCDQLCFPGDRRDEIKQKIKKRLNEAMNPYGVQVVGGGISNLVPCHDVIQQRIKNWQAHWKKEIAIELGQLEADIEEYKPEIIRAKVQIELLIKIAERLKPILQDENLSDRMLALCFTEAIQEMLEQSPNANKLPQDALELLAWQRNRLMGHEYDNNR